MAAVVVAVRRRRENAEAAREKVKAKRSSDLFSARAIFDELDIGLRGYMDRAQLRMLLARVVYGDDAKPSQISESAVQYVVAECEALYEVSHKQPLTSFAEDANVVTTEAGASGQCCAFIDGEPEASEVIEGRPAATAEPKVELPREEVLQAVTKFRYYLKEEQLIESMFAQFDMEGTGELTAQELGQVLQRFQDDLPVAEKTDIRGVVHNIRVSAEDVDFVMRECDLDQSGSIDRSELLPCFGTWKQLAEAHTEEAAQKQPACCVIA